jgi:hypothetical protein
VHDQRPEDAEVLCLRNWLETSRSMNLIQLCGSVHHVQVEHMTIEPPLKGAPSACEIRDDGNQNSAWTQRAREGRNDPVATLEVLNKSKAVDDIELATAKRVLAE